MKKIFTAMLMVAGGMLASCTTAPRVLTDLAESYPARSADSVMVFEPDETVPQQARKIGTVKVTDGGLTPTAKCLFGNMLSLAVKKSAENGANGFQIEKHKYPSTYGSTCHRIYGSMYVIPDSLVHYDVLSQIQKAELNQDIEMAQKDREYMEWAEKMMARQERMRQTPSNVLKLSAGPAFMTSEYEIFNRVYKSRTGYEFSLAYQHFWRNLGVGALYSHAGFSFDEGIKTGVNIAGPSFLFAYMFGKDNKWRFDYSATIGYGWYTEKYRGVSDTEGHVALMFDLGVEYQIAKNVAFGLQFDASWMRLHKPEDIELKDNEFYGIQRMGVLAGLRFYF